MRLQCFGFLVLFLSIPGVVTGTVRHVPSTYTSIQAGIDAAVAGDTVLVAPGTYDENINFLGKDIVVASRFVLTGDPWDIRATVIDGGTPSHPDTASCVLIISGEGPTTALEGFTLTGGAGTKWLDEHGAGLYREGGGILITLSSPTIKHNLIIDNEAINSNGCVSAGGGGIRVGDGGPRILNNTIIRNRGMYGGGIVLNYCSGAVLQNNIVAMNRVYDAVPGVQTFGGGGIWVLETKPGDPSPNLLENNTIVGNSVLAAVIANDFAGQGGGVLVRDANVVVRNTIIWKNLQTRGEQISGEPVVSYSDVEGGFAGMGNLDAEPGFADSSFLLTEASPCVDAGDPDSTLNDPEDPASAGNAAPPARGSVRNDIGAYGGPGSAQLAVTGGPGIQTVPDELDFGYILPGEASERPVVVSNGGPMALVLETPGFALDGGATLAVVGSFPRVIGPGRSDTVLIRWSPTSSVLLSDTLLLNHNDSVEVDPLRILLQGTSIPTAVLTLDGTLVDFGDLDASASMKDTVFTLRNLGTGADSAYLSIEYKTLQPHSAVEVSPMAIEIGPRDSLEVTFRFYPSQIVRNLFSVYTPIVLIDSRFTEGEPRLKKPFRFRLVDVVSVKLDERDLPKDYGLEPNYPNPFNPTTVIEFSIPLAGEVSLTVHDLLGNTVAILVAGRFEVGRYRVKWDAGGIASGTYFYRLQAGEYTKTRRLLLLR